MNIEKVLYAEEKAWGVGLPGDNETGVIAYELPEDVSKALELRGLGYLEGLDCARRDGGDWRGRFYRWKRTPIQDGRKWAKAGDPEIRTYLGQYGFDINISPTIEAEINAAISGSDAFFAYGQIGFAILVPSKRRAYFVYAG